MNKKKQNTFLNRRELLNMGFKSVGKNCVISRKIATGGLDCRIGDNIRIDDDVLLKGKIVMESNIHISRGCTLSGGNKGIIIKEFTAVSNYVQFFTKSDDYFQPYLPAATLSKKLSNKYSKVINKKISVGRCVLVGSMSVLLPGAEVGDFSSIGAYCTLINKIPSGYYFSNRYSKKNVLKKRNIVLMKKRLLEVKKFI